MNGLKKHQRQATGTWSAAARSCRVAEALRRFVPHHRHAGAVRRRRVRHRAARDRARRAAGRAATRVRAARGRCRQAAISVSGGVAVFPRDGDSPTLLLRAADQALYDGQGPGSRRRTTRTARRPRRPDDLRDRRRSFEAPGARRDRLRYWCMLVPARCSHARRARPRTAARAREPARTDHRRHRDRQDRHAAGARRALFPHRRADVHGRRQGRSGGSCRRRVRCRRR